MSSAQGPDRFMSGAVPLVGRREPWMDQALSDHGLLSDLIATHGSPINLIDPSLLAGRAAELIGAAAGHGIKLGVYFARKANKSLAMVDAALAAGHGVDVASQRELEQTLSRLANFDGNPDRIILTAAVKPAPLLERAVSAGVRICIDNADEMDQLLAIVAATTLPQPVGVVFRLQPLLEGVSPSRFGMPIELLIDLLGRETIWDSLRLVGVHFHLDGYDPSQRSEALVQALKVIDVAREQGHRPAFIDIGGGIPVRYLDEPEPWKEFWSKHRFTDPMTWNDRQLGKVYPMWQNPIGGAWLEEVLTHRVQGETVADKLRSADVALHCEPGRALAEGSGITVARVEFRKQQPDGRWMVGLAMNRTQCRSAADDFLIDPVLIPTPGGTRTEPGEGYLVGAYCIEAELMTWRRMQFKHGVAVGDLVAFINTGAYQMHILESASHQIPLARNLVQSRRREWALDPIDEVDNN